MKIAPEGRPFVAVGILVSSVLLTVAALFGGPWWIPFVLWLPISLWIPYFFRDPERSEPRGDDLVISPADGRIVVIDKVSEPDFMEGDCHRVAVFMNVFNVHVNRYPTSGKVGYRNYRPGRFFNATLDKASEHNEQMSLGIQAQQGPVLVKQIAGLIARRIVTDHHPGDVVRQGERMGLIRFGSRVEIFLPLGATITASVGDHVAAGETVLGRW